MRRATSIMCASTYQKENTPQDMANERNVLFYYFRLFCYHHRHQHTNRADWYRWLPDVTLRYAYHNEIIAHNEVWMNERRRTIEMQMMSQQTTVEYKHETEDEEQTDERFLMSYAYERRAVLNNSPILWKMKLKRCDDACEK